MSAGAGLVLDTLCDRLGIFHFPILDAELPAQRGCC